jgi:hypothetical protein
MNQYLPGHPSKNRQKAVRSYLHSWGIRPKRDIWRLAWQWAWGVACCDLLKPRWPNPREIAAQYVYLLLCDLRTDLKLPYRAGEAAAKLPDLGHVAAPAPRLGYQKDLFD